MTENQIDILIAKMLGAPDSLSESELTRISQDDELQDILEISSALNNACSPQPEIDAAAEWHTFRSRLRRKTPLIQWLMRAAAVFLGIILVSGIMVRITSDSQHSDKNIYLSEKKLAVKGRSASKTPDATSTEKYPEHSIIRQNAAKTGTLQIAEAKIDKSQNNQESKETDIDEYLRIQQAKIDNEIAMQAAMVYENEFTDMLLMYDITGEYDKAMASIIETVTMQ